MKTLTTPITNEIAASQSGWTELYDIYLKAAVTTPWGTVSVLRLTTCPGGLAFFRPKLAPEPVANWGDAQTYNFAVIKRETVKSDAKFSNDKIRIMLSIVQAAVLNILGTISSDDLYDTPIIIRKAPLSVTSPTANDCVVLWSGQLDSLKLTEQTLTLEASNDLATLQATAPRENMHRACRWRWADDLCTQMRWSTRNAMHGTVGSTSASGALTTVNSSDFTQDTGSSGGYGTDLVADVSTSISASSNRASYVNQAVNLEIWVGSGTLSNYAFHLNNHGLQENDPITVSASSFPSPLAAATTYYVRRINNSQFALYSGVGGPLINITTAGSAVKISTVNSFTPDQVISGSGSYWTTAGMGDWGTNTNGFWVIPSGQRAPNNFALLKPWIECDFGSAKTPRLWRITMVAGSSLEDVPRILQFCSSDDQVTYNRETYFECPAVTGKESTVYIPEAGTHRYWRINIRSRWGQSTYGALLKTVQAYEGSRNYWQSGRLTWDGNINHALAGISAPVLESYSGKVILQWAWPVAVGAGETFVIERGCNRSFNACAARLNEQNFGGFLDLPYQSIIR